MTKFVRKPKSSLRRKRMVALAAAARKRRYAAKHPHAYAFRPYETKIPQKHSRDEFNAHREGCYPAHLLFTEKMASGWQSFNLQFAQGIARDNADTYHMPCKRTSAQFGDSCILESNIHEGNFKLRATHEVHLSSIHEVQNGVTTQEDLEAALILLSLSGQTVTFDDAVEPHVSLNLL